MDEINEMDTTIFDQKDNDKKFDAVVCSSANYIVKGFENYLLLMDLVRPYSTEIFAELSKTFEYYVNIVKESIY